MAQKVIWSIPASKDLADVVRFIAKDSPHYAEEFLTEAQSVASYLIPFPRRGRKVPELGIPSIREVFLCNYRLIYEVTESHVLVLALIHGSRDFWMVWKQH